MQAGPRAAALVPHAVRRGGFEVVPHLLRRQTCGRRSPAPPVRYLRKGGGLYITAFHAEMETAARCTVGVRGRGDRLPASGLARRSLGEGRWRGPTTGAVRSGDAGLLMDGLIGWHPDGAHRLAASVSRGIASRCEAPDPRRTQSTHGHRANAMDTTPARAMEVAALVTRATPPTRAAPMADAVTFIGAAMPIPWARSWSGGNSARKDTDSVTWTAHRAPLDPKMANARCVPTGKSTQGSRRASLIGFPWRKDRRPVVYY